MRKFINKVKSRFRSAAVAVQTVVATKKAEGYVDSGVKILIAVVIGALLLAGLYTLFNTNILPTLTTKVTSLFNYAGSRHINCTFCG